MGSNILGSHVCCGGAYPYTEDCFTYNKADDTWDEFPSLHEPCALGSGQKLVNGNWWVSGGEINGNIYFSSVIFDTSSMTWLQGPDLPDAFQTHYTLMLNEPTVILLEVMVEHLTIEQRH